MTLESINDVPSAAMVLEMKNKVENNIGGFSSQSGSHPRKMQKLSNSTAHILKHEHILYNCYVLFLTH